MSGTAARALTLPVQYNFCAQLLSVWFRSFSLFISQLTSLKLLHDLSEFCFKRSNNCFPLSQ